MSQRIVECVPNFSEGRDRRKIERICDAIREVEGVSLLDVDPGAETNRTVVTFVGPPEAVEAAAFAAIRRAAEVIDMRAHHGAHARHGATDVCPFVPVSGVTMDDCVEIARRVGRRVGDELGIPVYLYERAAQRPERRSLAAVRAGEYEALPEKLARPEWKPDFGPAEFNARAGVVTIGAREFLIAYNVNLNTANKAHADDIAHEIRETGRAVRRGQTSAYYTSGTLVKYRPSKGEWPCGECATVARDLAQLRRHAREAHGTDLDEELAFFGRDPDALEGVNVMRRGRFTECRAVGWTIPEYGRAQISINLTDFRVTSPHEVLEACRALARERGLEVTGSEIVGMIPYEAIRASGEYYLARMGAGRGLPARDVVETAVLSMGLRDVGEFDVDKAVLGMPTAGGALAATTLAALADEVSRPSPAPGGGSIAALAGALAASLAAMVANLTCAKPSQAERFEDLERVACEGQRLKDALLAAVDEDTDAFNDVIAAMRLPRGTAAERAARDAAIQAGYRLAVAVPRRTAELSLAALDLCRHVAEHGNPASITDAGVGALLGRAAVIGAVDNVRINLREITDAAWVEQQRAALSALVARAEQTERAVRARVDAAL